MRTIGGGTSSGLNNDDDRCAQRLRGIQCHNCELLGHTRSRCPPEKMRNLNGIGRTKVTPPSDPPVKPDAKSCTALSAAKGLVTEPVLALEIGEKSFISWWITAPWFH